MFIDFFYYLKERLPVSIHEYMTLMETLDKGLIHDMVEFYYISRSILCKNEHQYDVYDIAFANYFRDARLSFPEDIKKQILDWLDKKFDPSELEEMSQIFKDIIHDFNIEELQKYFEELMKKQDEEHDFGHHWIGTQGDSQFGNMGQNPMGMRVGGNSGMRMAIQIAQKRIFQDYRKDIVLDTRQIKVAFKRLRKLEEIGKR
ncbi:MAG: VWA containing CoxE family protein, partial [Promethearchaeota archaeon]